MGKNEITKRSSTEIARIIDEAAFPFIEINNKAVAAGREAPFANPHLEAIRYELVRRPDGTIQKKERKEPLVAEITESIDPSVRVRKTDGEKVLSTRGNGKYNDEHKLVLTEACSVEVGEVAGFRALD